MMESMSDDQWRLIKNLVDKNKQAQNCYYQNFDMSKIQNLRMRSLLIAVGADHVNRMIEIIKNKCQPNGPRQAKRLV